MRRVPLYTAWVAPRSSLAGRRYVCPTHIAGQRADADIQHILTWALVQRQACKTPSASSAGVQPRYSVIFSFHSRGRSATATLPSSKPRSSSYLH